MPTTSYIPRIVQASLQDPIPKAVEAFYVYAKGRRSLGYAYRVSKYMARVLRETNSSSPTADEVLAWFNDFRANGDLKNGYVAAVGAAIQFYGGYRMERGGEVDGYTARFEKDMRYILEPY